MLSHRSKIYGAITAILLAVILIVLALLNFFKPSLTPNIDVVVGDKEVTVVRHPLSGEISDDNEFFAVSVMIDNAYDIRHQYGLSQADIIYEALVEGNITRLMAIFSSASDVDKLGPVRSARNYFIDWAEEYRGVYMHVGGSPSALKVIDDYDFVDINQIGAGESYFWRDDNLRAPHNVFSSDSNWLRAGELKDIENIDTSVVWNFQEASSTRALPDISLSYGGTYDVEWNYNEKLEVYQRRQTDDDFILSTGEQAQADNIIVQVIPSRIIDDLARRFMDTSKGGQVFIFNQHGQQEGQWKVVDNRTRFYDSEDNELKLVPGQTWVQIIDSTEDLVVAEVAS